ncbi:MAG TPA: AMP-binding protein [Chloroflexota bacterium]|nr:AMP-binding protein [Chloroflexota bacterium]
MSESSPPVPVFPGREAHGLPASSTVRLPEWLGRRAVDMPARPALIAGTQVWTYAELDQAAARLARQLAVRGIGVGDRVAVLLRNGPHFACAVHALIRLGAILVPLNLRLSEPELAWQVAHAGVRLLIHDQHTEAAAIGIAGQTAGLALMGLTLAADAIYGEAGAWQEPERRGSATAAHDMARQEAIESRSQLRTHIDLADIHCMMYTSGTTGRPKGVLLSYGNHWWGAIGSALTMGLHDDDRWLACLPLFHIGGLSILLRCAIYGIPVVFPDQPAASFDPEAVNRTLVEARATIVSVVSAQLQRMLDAGLSGSAGAAASLRCVLLGGGPAPRPLLEECARRAIPVAQTYGLTEACSQVATLAPEDALRKLGSAGRPLLPTELRIDTAEQLHAVTREEDRAEEHAHGEQGHEGGANERARTSSADPAGAGTGTDFPVGEILVRGPTVTPGYLMPDGDGATPRRATDAEGWLHTGDIGYLDHEGYLYVLDRRTDLIISGGENVYPAEVEAALLAHPAVAEAGVYGMPDPVWGQTVAAAVVMRPGMRASEAELIAFCRERLAKYKVPAHVERRETLPRNASGKLLRRQLVHSAHTSS